MSLDNTITVGQSGHISDHQIIAGKLNASFVDVKSEYGAAGDNTADDTAEIQAALDAVQTAGGGTVFIPRGTYKISSRLTVGADTSVQGAGRDITTIASTHAGTAMFFGTTNVGDPNPAVIRSALQNITFDGPGLAAGSVGVEVRKCKRMFAQNVAIGDYDKGLFINADDNPTPASATGFCTGGTYIHVVASGNTNCLVLGDNTYTNAECTDNRFISCYFNAPGDGTGDTTGVWIKRGNTNQFTNCSVEGADHGYLLGNTTPASSTGYSSSRNLFIMCRAENIKRNEGLITGGTDNQVVGGTASFHDRANGATNRFIGGSQPVDDAFTGVTTTLNGALGGALSNQTIVLTSGGSFPAPTGRAVGVIKIDSEYIQYETRTTNTLTLAYRGCFGSTVAAHSSGATVSEVGQDYALRVFQTIEPQEGRPTLSDDTRGMAIWESGQPGEGDALWIGFKTEGGGFGWNSPIPVVKAGAITDADFPATPSDGQFGVDTTNSKFYVRIGGNWKSVTVA